MFNHLELKAERTGTPEIVKLFLRLDNLEQHSILVAWKVTLPQHLRKIEKRALTGVAEILPSDSSIQLHAWRVRVLPFPGEAEQEIMAEAKLNYGGTYISDTVRASLNQILAESSFSM